MDLAALTGRHLSGPEMCAEVDVGGGVAADDTFLVYSLASIPSTWPGIASTECRSQLEIAAGGVVETLHILHDVEQMHTMTLRSLPRGVSEDGRSSIQRLPWFFLNAATSTSFAIVGNDSSVESLMCVLRRPWCVLELCCTGLDTLRLLLRFARQVSELDMDAYQGAVGLLSHEILLREGRLGLRSSSDLSVLQMEKVSKALFSASEAAYNGPWLRAIYTCAFQLNIAFSELGKILHKNAEHLSSIEDESLSTAVVEYIGTI